ncbi:hypothetical protein ABTN00_19980, partial [Acinetobacter baumannii]
WWVANKAMMPANHQMHFSGKIVAFIMYLNQIFRPLRVIADKFNVLQMGMIAAERVFKVLDNDDVLKETVNNQWSKVNGQTIFRGEVSFDHV